MGLFDFFRKIMSNSKTYRSSINTGYSISNRQNFVRTMNEIEQHKYVNDAKTKELYERAYRLSSNNLIDRHFYYNSAIDYYYSLRDKKENALGKCIELCKQDIEIAPKVLEEMSKEDTFKHYENGKLKFIPPYFPSFHRLAIIYEKQENYDKAIEICDLALKYNLKDGTKSGFEGRKERLLKKKAKYMK